jgi:hypothetical protein
VNHKLVLLIIFGLIASGCASNSSSTSGKGLVVKDFSISDNTLMPDQEANIQVLIANYNKNPTEIETLEIFNEGALTVTDKSCSSEDIKPAREGLVPEMECSWSIKAPSKDYVKGFESKPAPIKLKLAYNTSFDTKEPLKINYKELSDIENSGETSVTNGNGVIEINVKGQTPTDKSNPNPLEFKISNVGSGRLDKPYEISYDPSDLLSDCPNEEEPVLENTAKFTCTPDTGSTGVKNMFLTTSYKYIKTKNLNIKVVNQ